MRSLLVLLFLLAFASPLFSFLHPSRLQAISIKRRNEFTGVINTRNPSPSHPTIIQCNRQCFHNKISKTIVHSSIVLKSSERFNDDEKSNDDYDEGYENSAEESNINTMSVLYKITSCTYMAQIVMALLKSGPSLMFANAIGGPALAFLLTWILSLRDSFETDLLGSAKMMNGTLMIYSCICLVLVSIMPQLNKPFGVLFFTSAISTLIIAAKGYSNDLAFIKSTKDILPRIHKANFYAVPKDLPNKLYAICMLAVILLKTNTILGNAAPRGFLARKISSIAKLTNTVLGNAAPRGFLAWKVSSIAKLSILGGTLVTLRDAANQKLLGRGRFRMVNIFVGLFFVPIAVMKLKTTSIYNSLLGSLLLASTFACFRNALFA